MVRAPGPPGALLGILSKRLKNKKINTRPRARVLGSRGCHLSGAAEAARRALGARGAGAEPFPPAVGYTSRVEQCLALPRAAASHHARLDVLVGDLLVVVGAPARRVHGRGRHGVEGEHELLAVAHAGRLRVIPRDACGARRQEGAGSPA